MLTLSSYHKPNPSFEKVLGVCPSTAGIGLTQEIISSSSYTQYTCIKKDAMITFSHSKKLSLSIMISQKAYEAIISGQKLSHELPSRMCI